MQSSVRGQKCEVGQRAIEHAIDHQPIAAAPEQLIAFAYSEAVLKFNVLGIERFGEDTRISPMRSVPVELNCDFALVRQRLCPAAEQVLSVNIEIAGRRQSHVAAVEISLDAQARAARW